MTSSGVSIFGQGVSRLPFLVHRKSKTLQPKRRKRKSKKTRNLRPAPSIYKNKASLPSETHSQFLHLSIHKPNPPCSASFLSTMAPIATSISSPSLKLQPSFSDKASSISPSASRVSFADSGSRFPRIQFTKKTESPFTTFSSAGAEKDPKDDTPIELRYQAFPTVMDINQIREILPHRFPFLLVDRVIEYNPGVSAVAIKNVTINDNFFPGHFPERPIMPGVLMVEAMAQVAGIVMLQPEVGGSRDNFFFAGVDKVRFRKPVIAGDTLVMRMTLTKLQKRFGIAKMEGKAYVGGEVVCEGEFLLAMGTSS